MAQNLIYYPTDFSKCAENAFKYALQMAKATKSDIEIIHEIDVRAGSSASMISKDAMGMVSMLEDDAKVKLEQLVERLKDEGVESTSKIIFGDKLSYYLKNNPSMANKMVVMGTKGTGSVENRLFGSKTHKIIREIDFPVLVVPIEAQFDGISDILFAADYSTMNAGQFKQLTDIGTYFHSNIHAVHVMESEEKEEISALAEEIENGIRKNTDYTQLDFQMLYATNIEERLQTMIHEDNISLLVMVTKKRSFFERFFGTSLTKQMVYHTHVPMLVFQKK
jgi:nucleotide-binding universal stress UspA family protein|tara:strand:- start:3505 stop:4341 length:837 start_codon:yes stop_codon:yes gene_type:complete